MPPHRRPAVFRAISSTILILQFAACTSWSSQTGPPGEIVSRERPERVRVSRGEGLHITLVDVSATADSLIGTLPTGDDRGAPRRVAISLADITRIEVVKPSMGRTIALVAGIGAALYAIVASIAVSQIP